MHRSKPNVYQTLVLLWQRSRRGFGSCWRLATPPSGETSTDTFVQLVSLHFSGLIAIEDTENTAFQGSSTEKSDVYGWKNSHSPVGADLMVIAEHRPTPRVASTDTEVSPIPSSNCSGPTGLA
jgi:hypothetical protein